jgi:hypothetical protein
VVRHRDYGQAGQTLEGQAGLRHRLTIDEHPPTMAFGNERLKRCPVNSQARIKLISSTETLSLQGIAVSVLRPTLR